MKGGYVILIVVVLSVLGYFVVWSDLSLAPLPSCYDSDGGLDYYVRGYVRGNTIREYPSECNKLKKAYDITEIEIDAGSKTGISKVDSTPTRTSNVDLRQVPLALSPSMWAGYCKLYDVCIDSGALKEHYCSGGGGHSETYDCPWGCEDGACVGRGFKVGVAPIPRNFPGNESEWFDAYMMVQEVGELATIQSTWRDSIELSGEIPKFINDSGTYHDYFNFTPVYGINFFNQSSPTYDPFLNMTGNPINNWSNVDAREKYLETALRICNDFNPEYLGLAVEVNSYEIDHYDDFVLFMGLYDIFHTAVKTNCPDTKVFVTFQLETMKGIGYWDEEQWWMLDAFGDKLDLVVFTTYPEINYSSPEGIPLDYYSEITEHTNKKIAFSEIGWSSTEGGEEAQVEFIDTFLERTEGLDMEFVNWIFMHDLPGEGPLFKTGLRYDNGTAKDAWFRWKALKEVPYGGGSI